MSNSKLIIFVILFACLLECGSVPQYCNYSHVMIKRGEEIRLPKMCAAKKCEVKNGRLTLTTKKCEPLTDKDKLEYCIVITPHHDLPFPRCCAYFDCSLANFVKEMHEKAKAEGVIRRIKYLTD